MTRVFERYADPEARHGEVETLSEEPFVRIGCGALHEVGIIAERLGLHKVLLVCDPHFESSPAADLVETKLYEHNVASHRIASVTPTPRYADVAAAVEALTANGCDGVLSLGGGSTIDVGKATTLLGKHGGTIREYAHEETVVDSALPHIAVPTTAGTGAESSGYAFLLEDHGHEHTILHHDILKPVAVVIDPLVHVGMPSHVTATTGLNALCDAIEAYVSRSHTDEADSLALQAMHLIAENLPKAYADPEDLDARKGMARAAYLAGIAFEQAGLGIVDSIGLVLSEMFNIGQSAANAILLPHVMAYDAFSVGERMADVAQAMGKDVEGLDARGAAQTAIEAVQDLKETVGLTETLADRGLSWDDLYLCASQILNHPFIKRNPRPLDEEGLTRILLDSMETQAIIVDEPPEPSGSEAPETAEPKP